MSEDTPTVGKPDIRPAPRLELKWRYSTDDELESAMSSDMRFACDYGLVLPVPRNDIRSNFYDEENDVEHIGARSEVFYKFGTSLRGGGVPGAGEMPLRDGVHAIEDAKKLGGLEIWIESLHGDQSRYTEQST